MGAQAPMIPVKSMLPIHYSEKWHIVIWMGRQTQTKKINIAISRTCKKSYKMLQHKCVTFVATSFFMVQLTSYVTIWPKTNLSVLALISGKRHSL